LQRKSKHIFYVKKIFQKSCPLQENVKEYGTAGRGTDEKYNRAWRAG